MSAPKVGDRVRVVIEGRVSAVGTTWVEINEDFHIQNDVGSIVSIEVIEPPFVLPTKRWAQVTADGELWTLTALGMWVNLHGKGRHATKLIESSGLRVISEGVSDE